MNAIQIDKANNRVMIRAAGFWLKQPVEHFCLQLRHTLPALGAGLGRHALICDLTESFVSPAETIEALKAIFTDPAHVRLRARHVAFVTRSALARLQLERLATARAGIRVFADEAAALDWVACERAADALAA